MKNQKGQALIEALGFLALILCGSFLLLAILYQSILEIAVDDQMESFLICRIQNKERCESDFDSNLKKLRILAIRKIPRHSQNRYSIEVEYELPTQKYFSQFRQQNTSTLKKRELYFEKIIP